MKRILTAKEVLQFYCLNPHLQGGFGQDFGRRLTALDRYEDTPKLSAFRYSFEPHQRNIQSTIHGGALATMVDVITTIGILRVTRMRTISITLNTEFLNVVGIGSEVEIDTEVTKLGRNIVFTQCRIFTDPHHKRKLACVGHHVKSILHEEWDFMKDAPKDDHAVK